MPAFTVRVSKDYTVFCAGHFITYEGSQCEPLHGHNYRASVLVEGRLTEDAYVFNFVIMKKLLRTICDRLDHRMLLPRDNPRLEIHVDGAEVSVRYQNKRYLFPAEDVVLLPIPNTTAEMLAEWIMHEFITALDPLNRRGLEALEIEVEESFGQSASCRQELDSSC